MTSLKNSISRGGHKLTTDDCYTPHDVYDVVLDWVIDKYNLQDDTKIVRPFYPGGNYKEFDYPTNCVVIDNPPFSILASIRKWYMKQGIKYFLFCPTFTSLPPNKSLIAVCCLYLRIIYRLNDLHKLLAACSITKDRLIKDNMTNKDRVILDKAM